MISDISDKEKNIELIAKIEKVTLLTNNNNLNYLIVNLVDKSGRLEARLWNSQDEDNLNFKVGRIVKIMGEAIIYKKQLQLKINSYSMISEEDFEENTISYNDFDIVAQINVEKEYTNLIKEINNFKNKVYKNILLEILKNKKTDFKTFPAAINIHHNVVGGLFWHSISLYKAARAIKDIYFYAEIDWELVYCGCLLHDIGKLEELNPSNNLEYTDKGKLLGHISIGNYMVYNIAIALGYQNTNELVKLQHTILSSHGKNEYGSPVEPILLEAIIVSSLDCLDARIFKVNEEIGKINLNDWTGKIFTENNKSFFNHYKKETNN